MEDAVPVRNDGVSSVFDTVRRLVLVELEDGTEVARAEKAIRHLPVLQKAAKLAELNVKNILYGALARPISAMLSGAGFTPPETLLRDNAGQRGSLRRLQQSERR